MRFIFGDDYNNACKLSTFAGNDVIFPERGPWFSCNCARVLKIKYPEQVEKIVLRRYDSQNIRELKQRRRQRQQGRQKSNRFKLTKQQLCTCSTLFSTFLCRRYTTTTWKCLISRFVEDGNTKQQFYFSFPNLWYNPLEFHSKEICQHLTN